MRGRLCQITQSSGRARFASTQSSCRLRRARSSRTRGFRGSGARSLSCASQSLARRRASSVNQHGRAKRTKRRSAMRTWFGRTQKHGCAACSHTRDAPPATASSRMKAPKTRWYSRLTGASFRKPRGACSPARLSRLTRSAFTDVSARTGLSTVGFAGCLFRAAQTSPPLTMWRALSVGVGPPAHRPVGAASLPSRRVCRGLESGGS